MWGNIVTEISFITNFHLGFNNTKSDILIHLTQWQYWWWFWFSYLWILYFLLFMRIFRFRVLKFNPRIATTYRPHGKWGDLIVCLIPVAWCANIITNSNFILRMVEWQSESSLFTVRIRGKQWYWVYKFELKAVTDILTAPKNIGLNKWVSSNPMDIQIADDYLHILQLRTQQKWIKNYWENTFLKEVRPDKTRVSSNFSYSDFSQNSFKSLNEFNPTININDASDIEFSNHSFLENNYSYNNVNSKTFFLNLNSTKWTSWLNLSNDHIKYNFVENILSAEDFDQVNLDQNTSHDLKNKLHNIFYSNPFKKNYSFLNIQNSDAVDTFRWVKKGQGSKLPFRLIKHPLKVTLDNKDLNLDLFRVRWNVDESSVIHKVVPHSYFWTLKQKRYKRRKSVLIRYRYYRDESGKLTKKIKHAHKPVINQNNMILDSVDFDRTIFYRLFKKMKHKSENLALPFTKRLLRTRKILVLPAHVNLSVITNSFDVVHSWFIPGLGIKLDCIPGRATHHVLHIDNVGFYYGQCAEICGRYHHHMPIRLCALPFEHFLVWWHSFALPKIINTTDQKRLSNYYSFRKYVW